MKEKLNDHHIKLETSKFQIEVIKGYSKKLLYQLMYLEEKCLPIEMRNADSYGYYTRLLKDNRSVNLLLKYKERIIGLVVAKEYSRVFEGLANHDPDLRQREKYFYIDTVQILPRFKINGGLTFLIVQLVEKALRKKVKGICLHARKKNGLSDFLQKMFLGKKLHTIDNWLGFGEQFDFLEMAVNKHLVKKLANQFSVDN